MEDIEVTTISSDYVDNDPTTYSDELLELINQGRVIIEKSSESLQQNADNYASLQSDLNALNEQNQTFFCGIVVLVAALGVLSGLVISLLIKVH